jgi:hypothetical protein
MMREWEKQPWPSIWHVCRKKGTVSDADLFWRNIIIDLKRISVYI